MKAARTPCALWRRDELPPASTNSREAPEVKKELWGGEFWTDGYYFATISGRGDKAVIERYIEKQGRKDDVNQLKLFEF